MERVCYVVRHAESRYNAAVKGLSLSGMVGERDHGLSEVGRSQCLLLRSRLLELAAKGDADAIAMVSGLWLCSPLRRALMTAALARGFGDRPLVALPDGREHCMAPLIARDSVGTPRRAIASQLSREVGESTPVDLSFVDSEIWWRVAESSQSVNKRIGNLLEELYKRCEHQPAVFVGHSRALRDMFKVYSENRSSCTTKCGGSLASTLVANCAVLKLVITPGKNIRKADFLFDSGYKTT